MTRLLLSFLTLLFFQSLLIGQKGYEITLELTDYSNDSVFIANYLMDKQYLRDTAILENGKYVFSGDEELAGGMYLFVFAARK